MTTYYLTFTDFTGKTVTLDGSALYQALNLNFPTTQTASFNAQGVAIPGKIALNPLTFTLGSDALTNLLDQDLASGATLSQVNFYGYDTGPTGARFKFCTTSSKRPPLGPTRSTP